MCKSANITTGEHYSLNLNTAALWFPSGSSVASEHKNLHSLNKDARQKLLFCLDWKVSLVFPSNNLTLQQETCVITSTLALHPLARPLPFPPLLLPTASPHPCFVGRALAACGPVCSRLGADGGANARVREERRGRVWQPAKGGELVIHVSGNGRGGDH